MNILDAYNMSLNISNKKQNLADFNDKILAELGRTRELCINLDQIIENSLDGIFITDGKGIVLRVNKSYETLSGLDRKDIIGKDIIDFERENYISQSCTLIVLEQKKPVTIEQILFKTNKKALVTCNPIFNNGEIKLIVSNIRDMSEIEQLKNRISQNQELVNKYKAEIAIIKSQLFIKPDMIAEDKKMLNVLHNAQRVAKVDSTVLLLGETGVGKEEVAKYIHENSSRSQEHFVKINCGSFSKELIESELFGYERGAFTGARSEGKMGLFEVANKGTLFLDEIGEMSLDMQVKLLRVLQEGELKRVGGTKPIFVDIRIIAATNRNLEEMVMNNKFREDLFYRINVVPITIPPLRDRLEDIVPLANKFLEYYNNKHKFNKSFSNNVIEFLKTYSWPGNVRELKNLVERSVIMCPTDIVTPAEFPFLQDKLLIPSPLDEDFNLNELMEKIECDYIVKAYEKFKSVRSAAKHLGMKHSTFSNKYRAYKKKYG